jgi:hypothetical protein
MNLKKCVSFPSSVYFAFVCHVYHGNLGECGPVAVVANSADHHNQSSELLVQVFRHVSTEMLGAPSRWKDICNRVLCLSRRMNDLDVLRKVQIILNFKYT